MDQCDQALLELGLYLKGSGYQFVTATPATHRRVNSKADLVSDTLPGVFGWSRFFLPRMLPPRLFDLLKAGDAVEFDGEFARAKVRFSTLDDQLYIHSAFPTDAENSVFFGPDTYRFCRALRQDVAGIRSKYSSINIIDVGCGCGVGGLNVASLIAPRRAHLTLSDINAKAVRYSVINAALNRVSNVRTVVGDLFENIEETADYIICNPPFLVDDAKRAYRHGGNDIGTELSVRILKESMTRLRSGGRVLIYTASPVLNGEHLFLQKAKPILSDCAHSYRWEEVDPDIFGEELEGDAYRHVDRLAAVVLTVTV